VVLGLEWEEIKTKIQPCGIGDAGIPGGSEPEYFGFVLGARRGNGWK